MAHETRRVVPLSKPFPKSCLQCGGVSHDAGGGPLETDTMSKARTWSIPVNLDELTALSFHLNGHQEYGEFFAAMLVGLHGGPIPPLNTSATRSGYAFGVDSRQGAEAYRERCRVAGKKGGNPALTKGLTQPWDDLDIFDEPGVNRAVKGGITAGITKPITNNK